MTRGILVLTVVALGVLGELWHLEHNPFALVLGACFIAGAVAVAKWGGSS